MYLFKLCDDAVSEHLIVHEYSILYGCVFLHDGFEVLVFQVLFVVHLEDVIQLCGCHEAIVLLVYLLNCTDDVYYFVIT